MEKRIEEVLKGLSVKVKVRRAKKLEAGREDWGNALVKLENAKERRVLKSKKWLRGSMNRRESEMERDEGKEVEADRGEERAQRQKDMDRYRRAGNRGDMMDLG